MAASQVMPTVGWSSGAAEFRRVPGPPWDESAGLPGSVPSRGLWRARPLRQPPRGGVAWVARAIDRRAVAPGRYPTDVEPKALRQPVADSSDALKPTAAGDDYELHNIWELDADAGYPGPLVRRLPRVVAEQLANGARVAEDAALSEVRFVKERGHRLAVCLTSLEGSDLFVYRGDFLFTHVRLPAGALYRLVLDDESLPLKLWRPEALAPRRFSPAVWRVCLDGPTLFHGVDRMGCVLRRPLPEEKPARRWLAYGSSITQGFSPVTRQQCYVAQTARRLGVDVVNLGLSGSCHVEPAMAEHIAARDDWDFATLELGINVRFLLTPQEFEARAREFLRILTAARPGKPVVLFTLFPNIGDYLIEPDEGARRGRAFNVILRQIAADFAGRGVHLIEGADILTDLSGLTCDLVHPGTEGHTEMAQNLAERLRPIIE